jgi:arylsulfatase A-like enzyme
LKQEAGLSVSKNQMDNDTRPNIIFIITDQQRYDTVGALGYPHMETPTPGPPGIPGNGVYPLLCSRCFVCTLSCRPVYRILSPHHRYHPERRHRQRAHYLANVSMIDEKIGEILEVLKNKGYLDNAIVVFTSDHGDCMGDHGLSQKWSCYEQIVRTPMIGMPPFVEVCHTLEDRAPDR